MEDKAELVVIPAPAMGHILTAIEMAKLLILRQHNLSITLLVLLFPSDAKVASFVESLRTNNMDSRLKIVSLPHDDSSGNKYAFDSVLTFFDPFIESRKQEVRDYVREMVDSSSHVRVVGFAFDVFCSTMADVAQEFGAPAYTWYTSGAAMLGLHLHLQSLRDDSGIDITEFKDSDPDLTVPTYVNPFPVKLLPDAVEKTSSSTIFLDAAKRTRKVKGIMVNTFSELESYALQSLSDDEKVPPVYPVGPILNLKGGENGEEGISDVIRWLDDQPDSSVVFLCFGSAGSFPEPQVKEIAHALERSGFRFLWSLRKPPGKGLFYPTDYDSLEEVLPEGFLERTKSVGRVIGWAPQRAVLAHPAVRGFVSHCGWNSTLESVWFGVPMACWPIYEEQQVNAFQLVKEIGIGVEIKMDYSINVADRTKVSHMVNAEEIEIAIRKLMDRDSNPARKKAMELKEQSRAALTDGGSSYTFLGRFLEDVMQPNVAR